MEDEYEEDIQDVEPFLIDDKADEKNCFICSRYRNGTKICGTFKYTNDHFIKNGRDNIENWFSCELFTAKV